MIPHRVSLFAPFASQMFRWLFAAMILSDMGNWIDITALSILVSYKWGMGAGPMAVMTVSMGLPWVLVGPFAGVWVDRVSLRTWLIVFTAMRTGVVVAMVLAPTFITLLPLVLLKEMFGAVFDPARQRAIGTFAPRQFMPQAVALSQISVGITKILAPAIGGILVGIGGPYLALGVEASILGLAASLLICLPKQTSQQHQETPAGTSSQTSAMADALREGWCHVTSRRALLVSILLVSVHLFLIYLYDSLLVLWTRALNMSPSLFGWLVSMVGVGAVLSSMIIGQWRFWRHRPLLVMCALQAMSGVLVLVVAWGAMGVVHGNAMFWETLFFLVGIVGCGDVLYGVVLQTETPLYLMGRVSAVSNALQNAAMLVSPLVGAFLAQTVGLGWTFLLAGGTTTVLSLSAMLFTRNFRIRLDVPGSDVTSGS